MSKEDKTHTHFGCAGCGEIFGIDGDTNYCYDCGTYKYFGDMECDLGEECPDPEY